MSTLIEQCLPIAARPQTEPNQLGLGLPSRDSNLMARAVRG